MAFLSLKNGGDWHQAQAKHFLCINSLKLHDSLMRETIIPIFRYDETEAQGELIAWRVLLCLPLTSSIVPNSRTPGLSLALGSVSFNPVLQVGDRASEKVINFSQYP